MFGDFVAARGKCSDWTRLISVLVSRLQIIVSAVKALLLALSVLLLPGDLVGGESQQTIEKPCLLREGGPVAGQSPSAESSADRASPDTPIPAWPAFQMDPLLALEERMRPRRAKGRVG